MRLPNLPSVAHLAKAYDPNVSKMAQNFMKLAEGKPPLSYRFARRVARHIYSNDISKDIALRECSRQPNPQNRTINAEVIEIMFEDRVGRSANCFPYHPVRYPIRHDISVIVRPEFYMIVGGKVYIFWLNAWKKFGLNTDQLDFMVSIIWRAAITDHDDFANLESPADISSRPESPSGQ